MQKLFTEQEFESAKSMLKLPLKCEQCSKTFLIEKKFIKSVLKRKLNHYRYCSIACKSVALCACVTSKCGTCNTEVYRERKEMKKSKSQLAFCNRSCAAKYNNTHKTTGTRRSKLEIWLEEQLTILYPNLHIDYNKTSAIDSELDIYIPSLKLAVELNGIFHYEPIYGPEKLASIKNNDNRKFQACLERNIELAIIDTSMQNYFKSKSSQKYLEIICNLIDKKYSAMERA